MHDDGATNDVVGAMQRDDRVRDVDNGDTLFISYDVAQVTDVTLRVIRGTMFLL
jgi:hypothetical protein